MSRENVEIARRVIDASNRKDWDAVVADLHPDVEIDDRDIPDAHRYRGHALYRKWVSVWNDAWEDWRMEDLEVVPAPPDKVVALFRMVVRGKGSGLEIDRDDAMLLSFRDGRVSGIGYYADQQQALEAAGLPAGPLTT